MNKNILNRMIAAMLSVALVLAFVPTEGLAAISEELLSPEEAVEIVDEAVDDYEEDEDFDEDDDLSEASDEPDDAEVIDVEDGYELEDECSTVSATAEGDDLEVEAGVTAVDENITLVSEDAAESGEVEAVESSVVSVDHDSAVVVSASGSGCFSQRNVIEGPESSHMFHYKVELEEGQHLELSDDGCVDVVYVDEDGDDYVASYFDAPWAEDADGDPVDTHYVLEEGGFAQVVEPGDATYPIVSDPAWVAPLILLGVRVGGKVLLKYGSKIIKSGLKKAPTSRVANVLSDYKSKYYQVGNKKILLDKKMMKHVLTRHHPRYWAGELTSTNHFFHPKTKIKDVEKLIKAAIKQKRKSIAKLTYKEKGEYCGTVYGVEYKMVVQYNRIKQFYPKG